MSAKSLALYADLASRIAAESYAERAKVGCVIVKGDNIISMGYNGTVSGWDNSCELSPHQTNPEVLHAEENAILKLARDGGNAAGATVICTHACCLSCAKMIFRSGVRTFYYSIPYRRTEGIEFLKKAGVVVFDLPQRPTCSTTPCPMGGFRAPLA